VTAGKSAPIFLELLAGCRRLYFDDLIYVFSDEVVSKESRVINEVWIYRPNLEDYALVALMPTLGTILASISGSVAKWRWESSDRVLKTEEACRGRR